MPIDIKKPDPEEEYYAKWFEKNKSGLTYVDHDAIKNPLKKHLDKDKNQ